MAVKFLNGVDVVGSMNIVASDVPNLDASKITSGTVAAARMPDLSGTYLTTSGRAADAELLDGINSTQFVRSDQNAVTIGRHLDANTTWSAAGLSLFLGWYGNKIIIGNDNDGGHAYAAALGGNSIAVLNKPYFYKTAKFEEDINITGTLKASSQIRSTGWYNDSEGDGTGLGFEIGVSSGQAYALSYNRATSSYGDMNFVANTIDFDPRAGDVTIGDNRILTTLDGDTYLTTSGKAADSNLLDGIDSSSFLRSDANDTHSGTLALTNITAAAGSISNTKGSYLHIGSWGAGRTAADAVLVNTAYRSDILSYNRDFTIGSTTRSFNGSSNVSWTLGEIGAASTSHKDHSFSNGQQYYDSYGQGKYLRMFTESATFDTFRFRAWSNVETYNGTDWVSSSMNLDSVLDGREDTGFNLSHANSHFRFEINRSSGWPTTALFVLQSSWSNTNSYTCSVTLETLNGSVWEEKDSWTYSDFQRGLNLHTTSQTHDGRNNMRVTIDMDWTDATHDYHPLRRILFLSNFSGGETLDPWSWNYNKVVNFDALPQAGGVNLATQSWVRGLGYLTTYTDTNTQLSEAEVRASFTAGTNVSITNGVISSTTFQAAGNYFTDGDTVLNMTNNDGLVYDDATNKMYVKLDGTNREIYHTGNFTNSSANWNTAYGWGNHASAQYATEAWVGEQNYATDDAIGNAISNLIDSSPANLDTLKELAAALGDDASFSTTVTNSIATKMPQGQQRTDINALINGAHRYDPSVNLPTNEHHAAITFGNNNNVTGQIATHFQTGELYSRGYNSSWSSWKKAWNDSNFSLTDVQNGVTAHGWGDHASAGYASGSFLGATAKAANSELLDGLDLHTGRNNLANKVVRTQANGYVDFGWINTTSGNTNNTVTDIYVNTNDGYIRKATPAHFRSQITDASYDAAGAADVVNLRIDEEVLPAIPSAIDILTLLSTNNIVDWTTDQGNTNIHSGNYTNSTYSFAGSLFTSRNSGNPLTLDSCHSNMVGYTVDSSAAGFADGGLFVAAYNSSWVSQIFSNFRTGEISVRGKNSGTWQDWRFVHDSGHFSVADVGLGITAHGWGDHAAAGYAQGSFLGATAKAADSNLLDGLDSTSYMRDNGWNNNPGQDADIQPRMSSDFSYGNNAPHTGDLIRFGASGYSLQLSSAYSGGAGLSFRTRNGDNATWNPWRTVLHSGIFTDNSTNWNTAYTDRNKWDGGSTGLTAATGRTSLGLGTAATAATGDFATAAQGVSATTAEGWGDHGAAGYASEVWVGEQNYASDAAISTAIGTVTLASLGYTGATNANYITNNNQLTNGNGYLTSSNDRNYITDSRGAQRAPSYYNDKYAQWDFQNKADTLAGGDTWHGILTVSKWSVYDPSHRQEQIFFTGDDLKRRTATSDTTWGAVKTIWDSGNFNPAAKETAGAAAVVDARIDSEIIPSIPTDNSQLGNGAGYITGVATYNGGTGDGLVPGHTIAAANDQNYFLNGAGNWAIPPDTNTDTNTTYTGGTGMTLNGTVFNCDITSPADVALGNLSSSGNALAGAFTATGDITAFSDARVKENVETIPNAIEKVTALRGVNFNKIGEEKRSTGVIAQEVREVLPEVIHENEDGMLSVAYGNITGVLIEAIKEQQKQIDELKARLDGLTK